MQSVADRGHGITELVGQHRQELGLAALGFLDLVDVGVRADPHRDLAFGVPQRYGPAQMPAVLAVRPAEAMLELERLAGVDGVLPDTDVLGHVLGVDKLCPAPITDLLERQAGELSPLRVEIVHVAVGLSGEDFLRRRVQHEPQTVLAFPQQPRADHLLGDLGAGAVHTFDLLVPQIVDRAERETDVHFLTALLDRRLAIEEHLGVFGPARDAFGEDTLDHRADLVPELRPRFAARPTEDMRVLPASAQERNVGIVVEQRQVVAPPHVHGESRSEADAQRDAQVFRPVLRSPEIGR